MDIHVNIPKNMPEDKIVMEKKSPAFALVAVFAVLVVGALVWWGATRTPRQSGTGYEEKMPLLSASSIAKLPEGFPRWYILGTDPEVLNGAMERVGESAVSRKIDVRIGMTPRAVFAAYEEFFTKTGWAIRSQSVSDNVGAISADIGGRTLVITIEVQNRATIVHMNYIASS